MPRSRLQVTGTIVDRLVQLKDQQRASADAWLAGTSAGKSTRPDLSEGADPGPWPGSDPVAVPEVGAAYDRSSLGAAYADGTGDGEDPAPRGEVNAVKIASDVLASLERARRLADATPVRLFVHALARRQGHGADGGVPSRMLGYMQDLVRSGQTSTT